jgi:hypothetical protein
MKRLLPFALASTFALAACHTQVEGNGQLGIEQRPAGPFDEVEVEAGIEAAVTASAAAQALVLSGDSNLLQYIQTVVEGSALKVRLHGVDRIDPIIPLRLTVHATALHRLKAAEASILEVSGAGSDAPGFGFEVEASGRSNVHLAGPGGRRLQVNLSGGAGLDATGYPVAEVNLLVSGGSLLDLHTIADPAGSASAGSRVTVTGGGTCAALVLSGGAICQAH